MKTLLFKPTEFFKGLKKKPSLAQAMGYLAIGALVSAIFATIIDAIFRTVFAALVPTTESLSASIIATSFFSALIGPIVGVFIYGLFMKLSTKFFSIKAKYADLVAFDAYATAPVLLYQWVPIIGWIASIVHYIYLIVIGGKELYKVDGTKAFLAFGLVPFAMAMIVGGIIFAVFMAILVSVNLGGIPAIR